MNDEEKKKVQVNVKVSGKCGAQLQALVEMLGKKLGARISKAQAVEAAITALYGKEKAGFSHE